MGAVDGYVYRTIGTDRVFIKKHKDSRVNNPNYEVFINNEPFAFGFHDVEHAFEAALAEIELRAMERRAKLPTPKVDTNHPYIYQVYGRVGVGSRMYIGTVKNKSRFDVERLCKALELELVDRFPRGVHYEMMEYDPSIEKTL